MLEVEKYMGSFKDSITKRFEKQDKEFKSLSDKIKSFEYTQREYKKRLTHLEDKRDTYENEDFELQPVKSFFVLFFNFLNCINFETILYFR